MFHKITDVKIKRVAPQNGLLGFCDFVLDGNIRFQEVPIFNRIDGSGIRLAYPRKNHGLREIRLAEPIKKETFQEIEGVIKEAFKNAP